MAGGAESSLCLVDDGYAEAECYRACTGRAELPGAPFAILWLVAGRRSGKSFIMAIVACFLAVFKNWRPFLAVGERAVVLIVAADREQAKLVRRYVGGVLSTPLLASRIENETADAIELSGNVVIEVATCSYRTVRGRSVCVALLDEVGFWRAEDSANPDKEVWRAIRASMASFGAESIAVIASSPYAKRGLLWDGFKRYFGKDDARNLVWQAGTKVMNPTVSDEFLAEEFEADPVSAEAEYNAQFRSDIESFVSQEAVEAVVQLGCHERPYQARYRYAGAIDAATGSGQDAMTMAIGHLEDGIGYVDCLREVRPPFSPESVAEEFAASFGAYGIRSDVIADKWGSEFVVEAFARQGVTCEQSAKPKSDVYRELLPLVNSGKVRLLDNRRLLNQLIGLERKTARGGRDLIDHPVNGHDDLINAAALVLVKLSGEPSLINVWLKAFGDPPPAAPPLQPAQPQPIVARKRGTTHRIDPERHGALRLWDLDANQWVGP